mmetsp:Transcript_49217/g.159517  ORF Transcript_49217/g.159517 Transcript_49217/m.159517 type:complete len:330 (+) Transcript_49217:55-1044(+)
MGVGASTGLLSTAQVSTTDEEWDVYFQKLEKNLKSKEKINIQSKLSANTALSYAAMNGASAAVIDRLVAAGSALEMTDVDGYTPLLQAVASHPVKCREAAERLLHHGASPLATNANGWTALHWAAYKNSPASLIDALVAAGASVEAKKRDGGETPFLVAARASHLACAERLVHKHKADPRAVNVRGEAVLHVAAQHGAPIEVIDRLVDMECDIEAKKEDGATPLIVAARNGHAQVVERLIRHGADARAAMKSGWTALHCAAHHGASRETVEKLVGAGAEVDAVDRRGRTALHEAASAGEAEVAEMLVDLGADPTRRSKAAFRPHTPSSD